MALGGRLPKTGWYLGGILESKIWIDKEGFVSAPEGPGLGVRINEKAIEKYTV